MAETNAHPAPAHNAAAGETHATTEAEHGSGGLPQFEFQHWAGQIAWLLVLFAILYVLMSRVFTPRLRGVLDERAKTISDALTQARLVREEANLQAATAEAELADARSQAQRTAAEFKARTVAESARRKAEEDAKVAEHVAAAELRIGEARMSAMASVGAVAAETAEAIVQKLTGKAPAKGEVQAAIGALAVQGEA